MIEAGQLSSFRFKLRVPKICEPKMSEEGTSSGAAPNDPGQTLPSISLPRGGGALRGIGEKFAANPVTGTGSLSVPIATSPGRSGFGPQLSLSYDSGAGNGPFGLGWHLSLPSISRKTDKGLPRYQDAAESDVFILSAAEDLVPVLPADGEIVPPEPDGFQIKRYRPRTEGLFARIERWTSDRGETHWRSITRDNITTIYGQGDKSRIHDTDDPSHVFSWLICESYDDKGNAIRYEYLEENSADVTSSSAHERNRTEESRGTNRYLKRIKYCAATPRRENEDLAARSDWLMEVVFDYGEHHDVRPTPEGVAGRKWLPRTDPFSTYRAGFEVRTYRLCRRVLMFHRFPELGEEPCLVRSTDFEFKETPIASFIISVTQSGYVRRGDEPYLKKSLPPVEFKYSEAIIEQKVRELDAESAENLPTGLDVLSYQWVDLDGDGLAGILSEQGNAWYYKRNLSPKTTAGDNHVSRPTARFAPLETVALLPSIKGLSTGATQFLDLAGDGQPDLAQFDGPTPGFYEHVQEGEWTSHRAFTSLPNVSWSDPNLKFIDLTGDGHADILVAEESVFTWYPSLAEAGFDAGARVSQPLDDEKGPRLVFADGTQSIFMADLSGDGLTDIVRIRNGEVSYWPNLGYGSFGSKVTMDNAPVFDHFDQFDQKRIRLGDIDGSGVTDIIYLHGDGVRIYFNQSGNQWSEAVQLNIFPPSDNLSSVVAVDLLGIGTACLVWSSSLPAHARRSLQYVDLMGGRKPHLMTATTNNLGAETKLHYASSTKFYLDDKYAGRPWVTKLPFPVQVVEYVETFDYISRNHFVTRYAYHHGYFDGPEREFRGFGMVEQWDTDTFNTFEQPLPTNTDARWNAPPVHTRTWFHTGAWVEGGRISHQLAHEYFGAPQDGPAFEAWARDHLLDDTVLPDGELTAAEQRQACRALKGAMLRQEIYADDNSAKAQIPYTVTEQNFTIKRLQPQAGNRHAVFFTHPREAISYHYERNAGDPRIGHVMTLDVDDFGNVLKQVAIGYGRRQADAALPAPDDRVKQTTTLVTYTENSFTNAIQTQVTHRAPLPCESRTYELTEYLPSGAGGRFQSSDFVELNPAKPGRLRLKFLVERAYEDPSLGAQHRRLIEQVRTLYRKNDLSGLLTLGEVESLALAAESYKLAFTRGLLAKVYERPANEKLLPDPASVLAGQAGDRGGYVQSQSLKTTGLFPSDDPDGHWWIPSGVSFFGLDPAAELAEARQHFFLPRRYRDPFGQETVVTFDRHDLLLAETVDALGNRVTIGQRLADGTVDPNIRGNDYRVLQPSLVSDPNRNRAEVTFDALGMVVGTAVMGKPEERLGDSLEGFVADLQEDDVVQYHLENPLNDPAHPLHNPADPRQEPKFILGRASSRLIYDLFAYHRTKNLSKPQPPLVYTLVRETHDADLTANQESKLQHSFSYSDGFGREIQKKIQAEPEKTNGIAAPRWVGSGWTIFNNKGKPVQKFEPFFSNTHRFQFDTIAGVSSILFYDPVERVVATLHPNHTYEKVVFDPWQQATYDVNDTVAPRNSQTGNPRTDPDISGFTRSYFDHLLASPEPAWQAWREQRKNGALGTNEQTAAAKAAAHADTPANAYFDALGRPFLTFADNGPDPARPGQRLLFATRVELDIEGNQRAVRDAIKDVRDSAGNPVIDEVGRIVMQYDYDLLGNRIRQSSMEAGARWMLNDVTGKPIRAWDSRGHNFSTVYDQLRRPVEQYVRGTKDDSDPRTRNRDILVDLLEYGEGRPNAEALNVRTRLYRHSDSAGVVTNAGRNPLTNLLEGYDFKGNPLRGVRSLVKNYTAIPDWLLDPELEEESFTSSTRYDALNRPVQVVAPHNNNSWLNVVQPVFNEANLLERVNVWLEVESEPAELRDPARVEPAPVGVANIDYNEKGQRVRIDYRNNVSTSYEYDALTFRLTHLRTSRNITDFPADQVQNLSYVYDPAGNITHIQDDAQQAIYFKNVRVEPSADYTYDAIYRLIEATGREHLGQTGGSPIPHSHNDAPRVGVLSSGPGGGFQPNDGNAMGRYCESYVYDAVGNFKEMIHRRLCTGAPSWTRSYNYGEASLIENSASGAVVKNGNRLSSTTVGATNPTTEEYLHDAHGNMVRMPHLGRGLSDPNMHWDYKDQLRQTDLGGGGVAFYVYDAGGQRVRKVWEKSPGLIEERIYLGGFEIFRRHSGAIGANSATLERETLHVMDDKQRIALVETRTLDTARNDPSPRRLIRYQFGNHLGSSSLELDERAQIISYEEYTPYGSTSYQAVRSVTETSKRYRYNGKERDEESGLYYYGARYYAPWTGRWSACDPAGMAGTSNLYEYVLSNPARFTDKVGMEPQPSQNADEAKLSQVAGSVNTRNTILVEQPKDWRSGSNLRLSKGTAVETVSEGKSESFNQTDPAYRWRQVRILEGEQKGQVGWVMDVLVDQHSPEPQADTSVTPEPANPVNKDAGSASEWKPPADPSVVTVEYWQSLTPEQQKVLHYHRNEYQSKDIPKLEKDLKSSEWEFEGVAVAHNLAGATGNKDYRGKPDGPFPHNQGIFDVGGNRVTSPENMGTYDFITLDDSLGHYTVDVEPWLKWGNSPDDTTTGLARFLAWSGGLAQKGLDYLPDGSAVPFGREDDKYHYFPGERIDKRTGRFEFRAGPKQ